MITTIEFFKKKWVEQFVVNDFFKFNQRLMKVY